MKIALIINPKLHKQTNVILENTIYAKNVSLISDNEFKIKKDFFDFIEDLIGKGKLGKCDNCYVSVIDTNKLENCIDPVNKLLGVLTKINSEQNESNIHC